jgi:hypothetical protein
MNKVKLKSMYLNINAYQTTLSEDSKQYTFRTIRKSQQSSRENMRLTLSMPMYQQAIYVGSNRLAMNQTSQCFEASILYNAIYLQELDKIKETLQILDFKRF